MDRPATAAARKVRRVLQVNARDQQGGAQGSAWNLFKGFEARGLDSWLAVGSKTSDDPNVLVIPTEDSRSSGISNPLRTIDEWRGMEPTHFPGTRRLLELPPQRPDILHCHNLHSGYFDLRRLPWFSRQLPVILNLRDTWALTGHCAGFQGCERWKTGCGACPDLTIYPPLRRDTTAANWSRKARIFARSRLYVTAPSQWLLDQVEQSMLRGVETKMIPNGIDTATFCPGNQAQARRSLDLPEQGEIVLVSAHSSFKPLQPMLDVLRAVRCPAGRLTVVCLSKIGEPEQHTGLDILYRPYQFDPRVMAQYYRAADVYFQISNADVACKAMIEAAACGTTVVINSVAANSEYASKLNSAVVLADGARAMTAALERVLSDPSQQARARAEGWYAARRNFCVEAQIETFLAWYEEVIEDWSAWQRNQ